MYHNIGCKEYTCTCGRGIARIDTYHTLHIYVSVDLIDREVWVVHVRSFHIAASDGYSKYTSLALRNRSHFRTLI